MRALPFILCVLVVGCISAPPAPETMREKYVAAEVSYQAAVATLSDLVDQGTIKRGDRKVIDAVKLARGALDEWGRAPDDPAGEIATRAALRALQTILRQIRGRPT
jgi:hypothetical protein